jgi:Domain of unknown function (DUF4357)
MEAFLANLRVILPVVGLDLLKPRPTAAISAMTSMPSAGEVRFEIRHHSDVRATAVEEEGEFVILEGSQALRDAGYQGTNSYGELKQELLAKHILLPVSEGRFEFKNSYAFKSPSAAAAFVLDRNANGRQEWKVGKSEAGGEAKDQ